MRTCWLLQPTAAAAAAPDNMMAGGHKQMEGWWWLRLYNVQAQGDDMRASGGGDMGRGGRAGGWDQLADA